MSLPYSWPRLYARKMYYARVRLILPILLRESDIYFRHTSDVEAEVDDIAFAHDVVFAFEAGEALLAGGGVGAGADEVVVAHDFGADEAALDVGVDGPGGLRGAR